jgi:hypothetical protein
MKEKVQGPAIGLIVVGALGGVMGLLGLVMTLFGTAMNLGMYQGLEDQLGSAAYFAINLVSNLIGLAVSGFLIWAGMQMKELKNRSACFAACIVAMIPCGGCCIIGIPIGIWGLVVLSKDEVKQAFTS